MFKFPLIFVNIMCRQAPRGPVRSAPHKLERPVGLAEASPWKFLAVSTALGAYERHAYLDVEDLQPVGQAGNTDALVGDEAVLDRIDPAVNR